MKPDIVLRRLAIAVASNDHSYMPQLVSIAVGKNRRSWQEIRDVRIPSNVTGYVPLLDNANITHPCKHTITTQNFLIDRIFSAIILNSASGVKLNIKTIDKTFFVVFFNKYYVHVNIFILKASHVGTY